MEETFSPTDLSDKIKVPVECANFLTFLCSLPVKLVGQSHSFRQNCGLSLWEGMHDSNNFQPFVIPENCSSKKAHVCVTFYVANQDIIVENGPSTPQNTQAVGKASFSKSTSALVTTKKRKKKRPSCGNRGKKKQ